MVLTGHQLEFLFLRKNSVLCSVPHCFRLFLKRIAASLSSLVPCLLPLVSCLMRLASCPLLTLDAPSPSPCSPPTSTLEASEQYRASTQQSSLCSPLSLSAVSCRQFALCCLMYAISGLLSSDSVSRDSFGILSHFASRASPPPPPPQACLPGIANPLRSVSGLLTLGTLDSVWGWGC
jgi:hypothetical protein